MIMSTKWWCCASTIVETSIAESGTVDGWPCSAHRYPPGDRFMGARAARCRRFWGMKPAVEMGICLEPARFVTGLARVPTGIDGRGEVDFEHYQRHTVWDQPGGLANRSGAGDQGATQSGASFARMSGRDGGRCRHGARPGSAPACRARSPAVGARPLRAAAESGRPLSCPCDASPARLVTKIATRAGHPRRSPSGGTPTGAWRTAL